jgi:putative transcriptional regulator
MNTFGECYYRGENMLVSQIGSLMKVSKYRREYIIEKLGVTQNTMSNWVQGKTYPTMDKAYILADLLEVKVDDLYNRTTDTHRGNGSDTV